jgi:hypothetical protein
MLVETRHKIEIRMTRLLLTTVFAAVGLFGATTEPAGPPPAGVDPAIAGLLQKDGIRVKDGDNVVGEFWFRASAPSGTKTGEPNVTLTTLPHGTLVGIANFPQRGSDRRGQSIKPGMYTMRLSYFPENGDHQGVAPQRDFFLLSNIAEDKDPKATPNWDTLTKQSMKASGTPHPAVFSVWKVESDFKPGIAQEGEHDWVLQTKVGDIPIAMIVIGKFDH